MNKKPQRIALFSPTNSFSLEQANLSDILIKTLRSKYTTDVFTKSEHETAYPFHEFTWRNIKLPYDLIVYNFGSGLSFEYMLPYILIHPGLIVLRRSSITESLLKIHQIDKTYSDLREEMIYAHGEKGGMISELLVNNLWGRPLEVMFSSLKLLIESSYGIACFDPSVLKKALSVSRHDSFYPLVYPGHNNVTDNHKKDTAFTVSICWHSNMDSNFEVLSNAVRELSLTQKKIMFKIISDENTAATINSSLTSPSVQNNCEIITPKDDEEVARVISDSDISLYLESPSYEISEENIYRSIHLGSLPIITDIQVRSHLPDNIFVKIDSRLPIKGIVESITAFSEDRKKINKRLQIMSKWMQSNSQGQTQSRQNLTMKDLFTQSFLGSIEKVLEIKKTWKYPIDYPKHLQNYKYKLTADLNKRLKELDNNVLIKKAINDLTG